MAKTASTAGKFIPANYRFSYDSANVKVIGDNGVSVQPTNDGGLSIIIPPGIAGRYSNLSARSTKDNTLVSKSLTLVGAKFQLPGPDAMHGLVVQCNAYVKLLSSEQPEGE